jgi:hypothetical protein
MQPLNIETTAHNCVGMAQAFMVYMGVKVTAWNGIYGDSVKIGAVIGVPHLWTPLNGFRCIVDVMEFELELEFMVGVVLNDGGEWQQRQ